MVEIILQELWYIIYLFTTYIRNDGTFINTFAVSALFYGTAGNSVIGDFSLILYESLLGFIPMFILEKCIKTKTERIILVIHPARITIV